MKALFYILAAVTATLAVSCAEEKSESPESVQERIIKAYVEKYYPDAVRSSSGLYMLEQSEGTGRTPLDTSYVLVEYTISYLDGSYSSYTYDSIAKQLGAYTHSGYYDPRIWSLRRTAVDRRSVVWDVIISCAPWGLVSGELNISTIYRSKAGCMLASSSSTQNT